MLQSVRGDIHITEWQSIYCILTLSAPSRFSAEKKKKKKSFLGNFTATLVFMLERKILSSFFIANGLNFFIEPEKNKKN